MIEVTDLTGHLVSLQDIDDAIEATRVLIVSVHQLALISPQAAVNMPNVIRCLKELKAIRQVMASREQGSP